MNKFTRYQEVLDYLYAQLPMYQRVGGAAFRKDLRNTIELCKFLNFPQHRFKSIHVAGTNGKGSSSHMLASVLQSAGYRTGLYTSPHLKDFTERIGISGKPVTKEFVLDFVNRIHPMIDRLKPSFFEITVAMAFDFFARQHVDIAVVEVGMGGRLDSTNVILPEVSLITNISDDHKQWLGDTLEKIAGEKAGIIKPHIPVVISEQQEDIKHVFGHKAQSSGSRIYYAYEEYEANVTDDLVQVSKNGRMEFIFKPDLTGSYQLYNLPGVLKTLEVVAERGFRIENQHLKHGLENVVAQTGLKGRWQILRKKPMVICDVGHNLEGVRNILMQIQKTAYSQLHMVWGMVEDKESHKILSLLPKDANYYFCQAGIPRAKKAQQLREESAKYGLFGIVIEDVNTALAQAIDSASDQDLVFVGGSNFVVAEVNDL